MTPEAQRTAIAKACGWTEVQRSTLNPNSIVGRHPKAFDIEGRTFVPNYLSDLNAMHEAEKVLTEEQQHDYWKYLEAADDSLYGICFRSAAQRAEAFLHTLNLWKD